MRSCGLTPVLQVRLDDVLDRRHLPPLGLKDFEEYLLYVEQAPENLYFILWLKEYTTRYHAWTQRAKAAFTNDTLRVGNVPSAPRRLLRNPPPPDPSLAMFYARAKQTFFTPRADYELDIPSDILGPFHSSSHSPTSQARVQNSSALWYSQSAHPDPAVFAEVAIEARSMLNESLQRFVRVASTNVGSQRAACGIAGGCFFILVTGVLPLTLTTGRWNVGPHGRFIPLTAFPGLWLGLTILIASLQGVCICYSNSIVSAEYIFRQICLMIYVFGDLRQLRKFELARPAISHPITAPISSISGPILPPPPVAQIPSIAVTRHPPSEKDVDVQPTSLETAHSVSSYAPNCRPFSPTSSRTSVSATSCGTCQSDAEYSEVAQEIEVSAAVFDEEPAPEGPATATCLHRPEYQPPSPPPSIVFPTPIHHSPRARIVVSTPNIRTYVHNNSRNESVSTLASLFGPTAGFIPPQSGGADEDERFVPRRGPHSSMGRGSFDFDLLPRRKRTASDRGSNAAPRRDTAIPLGSTGQQPRSYERGGQQPESPSHSPTSPTLSSMIGRAQYKCNKRPYLAPAAPVSAASLSPPRHPSPPSPPHFSPESEPKERRRFSFPLLAPSFTAGVPAFASPLTQIRSPVVKRAQWEVVVRSGIIAFFITGAVIGVIIGVVP